MLKKTVFALLLICCGLVLFAQTDNSSEGETSAKFALVIGNGNYSGLTPLANPVNDANDIAAVLEYLGFNVDKVLNGSLEQMEDAVIRLKDNLSAAEKGYGFFYYAGHGIQSGGENFLIPVNANIPGENFLRNRAMSVQQVLDDLNDARNSLNVVVLDACRDNPFGWSRSGSRGLSIVSRQPSDSIIVYATSAGQRASDGAGRNGLFTSQLINNLATPGLEVKEVFNRTGSDVARLSNNDQIPAIYSQFFGTAYLGETPVGFEGNIPPPSTTVIIGQAKKYEPEKFWSIGASIGSSFAAPWLITTVHGTIAPFKYSFFELGFDLGFAPLNNEIKSYYSMYPFVHAAFFWPFTEKLGIYAGVGGGLYIVSYKIEGLNDYSDNFFAAGLTAGIKLFDMLSASYTLRTNFNGVSHKVSAGYCYRFR
ncbi:MAG: caspase family protein [Treponema sp.]|nr:caspase family protein [Treponema sp.]